MPLCRTRRLCTCISHTVQTNEFDVGCAMGCWHVLTHALQHMQGVCTVRAISALALVVPNIPCSLALRSAEHLSAEHARSGHGDLRTVLILLYAEPTVALISAGWSRHDRVTLGRYYQPRRRPLSSKPWCWMVKARSVWRSQSEWPAGDVRQGGADLRRLQRNPAGPSCMVWTPERTGVRDHVPGSSPGDALDDVTLVKPKINADRVRRAYQLT